MSKFVSFALFVSAVLLVHVELQKTREEAWGKISPLEKQKGKCWVVVFSGLNDAPDPYLLPGSARLTLLCVEPRLAERDQQLLKESYGQRL